MQLLRPSVCGSELLPVQRHSDEHGSLSCREETCAEKENSKAAIRAGPVSVNRMCRAVDERFHLLLRLAVIFAVYSRLVKQYNTWYSGVQF
jgi:hypothetical protein